MRYLFAGVSLCALAMPAHAADEYWTRGMSVAETIRVISDADPASMDKPTLHATFIGLLANVLFDVKTGEGYTASNVGSYRVTGSRCTSDVTANTRSFAMAGLDYPSTSRVFLIDWQEVETIYVRGKRLTSGRSEAKGPADSILIDSGSGNVLAIQSGTADNAERLYQAAWQLKLACMRQKRRQPSPVYQTTPPPSSQAAPPPMAPPPPARAIAPTPPPLSPPPPSRAIAPPPSPPMAPLLRAPTRDELSSVNIGGENLKSRMNRVPVFASSVPQASQPLAGCLKLDTDTNSMHIRRILNMCLYPISITGKIGKPRAFAEECDAYAPSQNFIINAFSSLAIGTAPSSAVFGYSSFCFAEISNISVIGPTVLPADAAAAQQVLSTMWNGTGALLQFSEYDPDGDENRFIRGSRYSNVCKTEFDASQVKSKYGAPIKNNRTSIDWSIPSKWEVFSAYNGQKAEMSNRIYVFPVDREKYPNNPAIWFDDLADSLKASRAIAVLVSRCGPNGK